MRYKVLRHSYGFKGRRWYKGEIVDIEESENPPVDFFEPLSKNTVKDRVFKKEKTQSSGTHHAEKGNS